MRHTAALAAAIALLAGCDSPPAQPPQDSNLVNATATDQAFPSGAEGNEIITGSGTVNTPGSGASSGGGNTAAAGDGNSGGSGAQPSNEHGNGH